MPWKSLKQARWGHSPAGIRALGKKRVMEYDRATEGKKLPKKVKRKTK